MNMSGLVEHANYIYTFFALIIFGLSIYLGIIVSKVRFQSQKIKQKAQELDRQIQEKAKFYQESIIIICKATIQEQCELSEACIRVKKILEYFPNIGEKEQYQSVHQMYDEIKDFATHGERKKLSKQEIYNQDKQRFQIEQKYQEKMLVCLGTLQKEFEALV